MNEKTYKKMWFVCKNLHRPKQRHLDKIGVLHDCTDEPADQSL